MTSRPALALLAAFACLLGAGTPGLAVAQTPIGETISSGVVEPLPIAVPAFSGDARGAEIAQVITGNLERSGLFKPIDAGAYPERNLDIGVQPMFDGWKSINAQALVNGQVTVEGDGRLRVDFRLWDIFSGEQLLGLQFTSTPENWRRVAHKISDAVYERLTGEKGYFDSRVVFVAESGPRKDRIKRLMIMDQDGANPSSLTDGSYIVMTPRFSANSQEITYMALRPTGSSIYLFNIETARQETLGKFPGMVFAPRFSPDGNRVGFSVERGGNSDIWVMNLTTRSQTRLTTDPGIDTSPSFSPDGSRIVFNSDRGGSPQLYVMGSDGSGARRISRGGGLYTTPVWSPTGDFIAFTKQQGGMFHIGVMRPDGSDERILTTSYLDEGPTWAPNGRVLMFFRETQGGAPRLWTVDITGRILRPAPYQGSGSDPAWSPLLN
ncbi:MAG TPA: Tol-Pal system beta propeller repeat protein TolB [Caulobacter sp.]|nr:Tol-Pal system beta propeller repeat protein TolB [Caulobacter sp.]